MTLTVPVPDQRRRFLPQITLGRVTLTIPHLAKARSQLYIYLVGLMVTVRLSYGYEYTRGLRTSATRPVGIPVPVA